MSVTGVATHLIELWGYAIHAGYQEGPRTWRLLCGDLRDCIAHARPIGVNLKGVTCRKCIKVMARAEKKN